MNRICSLLLLTGFLTVRVFAQQVYSFDGFPFGTSRSIIEAKHHSNVVKGVSSNRLIEFNDQRYSVYEYIGEFGGFLPTPSSVKYLYDFEDRLIAGTFIWHKRTDWSIEDMRFLTGRIEKLMIGKYGVPLKIPESDPTYVKYGYRFYWGLGDIGSIVLTEDKLGWIRLEYSHSEMVEKHSKNYQRRHQNEF
jgi:hypothetical protein